MDFPSFKYSPRAFELGLFEETDEICQCCQEATGFCLATGIYCKQNLEVICPWCVASGEAAKKFKASFIQYIQPPNVDYTQPPQISAEAEDELMHRTPGYVSWQGSNWLVHCGDGCEFHGDLPAGALLNLPQATLDLFKQEHSYLFTPNNWGSLEAFNEIYEPAGDLAIYQFKCRHCGLIRLHCDMS